jgi:hypothetical protein
MHFLHWRNALTKGRRGRNTTIQYHKGISWFISRLTEQALQSCRPQTCSRCIFLQLVRSFGSAYLFEYMLFKLSRLAPFISSPLSLLVLGAISSLAGLCGRVYLFRIDHRKQWSLQTKFDKPFNGIRDIDSTRAKETIYNMVFSLLSIIVYGGIF